MTPTEAPDELDALRRRNPHAPDVGRYREAPLDARAERDLRALTTRAAPTTGRPAGRRPRARPLVLAAVGVPVAAVLAGALAVTTPAGPPVTGGTAGEVRAAQGEPVPRVTDAAVVLVLHQMAGAAAEQPAPVPGQDQFAYLRLIVATGTGPLGGPIEPGPLQEREEWLPQRAGVDGWIVEGQDAYPISYATDTSSSGGEPVNTHAGLAQLPTDPAELLGVLREDAAAWGYDDVDYGAFNEAGGWLAAGTAPPEVVAALYRAAALVPGVVVVPDAVDAAGRRGTGLAFDDRRGGLRHEWVVDESTSTYLGSNWYQLFDTTAGPAGLRTGASAVLARGVAESAGAPPVQVAPVP